MKNAFPNDVAYTNAWRVRTTYPLSFVQVLPFPERPHLVRVRRVKRGGGEWVLMTVPEALEFKRRLRQAHMRSRRRKHARI